MKVIDEKGKLFGWINIIDLLIVVIILGAILGVGYKFGFISKISSGNVSQNKAIVTIWIKSISGYTVDAIAEGDSIRELKSNSVIGKVIKKEVKPTKENAADANGNWVLSEVPEKNDVFLTIETTQPSTSGDIKLGSKDAKVGASLDIKGPRFQVMSYIVGVE